MGWAEQGDKENNELDWVKDLQDIHALVQTNQVRYLQITVGQASRSYFQLNFSGVKCDERVGKLFHGKNEDTKMWSKLNEDQSACACFGLMQN